MGRPQNVFSRCVVEVQAGKQRRFFCPHDYSININIRFSSSSTEGV